MSSETTTLNYLINLQLSDSGLTYTELRRIELSIIKIGADLNRLFPNSNAAKMMAELDKLIMLARQAQIAIRAVEMASGPIGWGYAAVTVVSAAISGYSMYESTVGV